MRYYEIPKKYNYPISYLGLNSRLINLEDQLKKIKAINIPLLEKIQSKINETRDTKNFKVPYEVIYSDITDFKNEYKRALNEVNKFTRIYSKGLRGEDMAIEYIDNFKGEWNYIQSANINVLGQNIENDCIIISKYGVYTIEIKSIGNNRETLNFDKLGRTTRLDRRGNVIDELDILGQSSRHLALLKKYFCERFEFIVPVEQIVLIASNINIKNKSPIPVLGINTLYPYISNNRISLNQEEEDLIYKDLIYNLNEEKAYAIKDFANVLNENYINIMKSVKQELIK